MKLLSFFSGIGAFEKALDRLGINYQLVNYCEIDKYASKSYSAIHGVPESMNLGDITKVDEKALPKDVDLICYGFPCQDISLAGKQKGLFNEDGTTTRSGLFFDALRIIKEVQPKVAIAENVKNLTSKKFSAQFQIVLESLEEAGYNNYWQILNAKDYGIPHNRERVFIVSIRKDIDTGCFRFPEAMKLERRMIDYLEPEHEIADKYYLSEAMYDYCMGVGQKESKFPRKERFLANINRPNQDIAVCISTHAGSRPVDNFVKVKNGQVTFETISDETNVKFLKIKEATKKGYAEAFEGDSVNLAYPNSKTRRGRVGHQVCQTLTTSSMMGGVVKVEDELMIRKLTPKECIRLIGFSDEDYDAMVSANISDTQIFKQSGNSIVVSCPYYIIKALIEANIFIERENKEMEMKVSEYQLPEKISFNFEELKMELTAKVSMYETMVYTEENIKDAKADRANLNKLKKALNDERIRREKEYMVPFNEFKAQIAEIISIIDKPCMVIDQQVKAFEDKQKDAKKAEILEYWESEVDLGKVPTWLKFEQIFNEKWLNASASMNSVKEEIIAKLEQVSKDEDTLSNLPEFGFEAVEVYKSSLDMNKAISEAQRMSQIAKAKAEAEAKKAEPTEPHPTSAPEGFMNPPVEDKPKQWIKFQAYMSVDDAVALKQFFNDRNIEFKAV